MFIKDIYQNLYLSKSYDKIQSKLYNIKMDPEVEQIKCPSCAQLLKQHQLSTHIKRCTDYTGIALSNVKKLTQKLSLLELKLYSAELRHCLDIVDQLMLQKYLQEKNVINAKDQKQNMIMEQNQNVMMDVYQYGSVTVCKICKKKFNQSRGSIQMIYIEECWHQFCLPCIKKHIEDLFVGKGGDIVCPFNGCERAINQYQIRSIVGDNNFQEMQKRVIRNMMNMVQCVKCKTQFSFIAGNPKDAPPKNQNGKVLTAKQKEIFAKFRFLCNNGGCKTEQCKQCRATPFHTGYSCQEFKNRSEKMKCRYCGEILTVQNGLKTEHQALSDICNSKQCTELSKNACTKILKCGHSCCGVRGQLQCLFCLNEQCGKNIPELNGQTGQDYCNICFIQSLTASPCIRSGCGHIFHEKCLRKRYQIRWLTPRIIFNFCLCPLCKKWLTVSKQNKLAPTVNANLQLFQKMQKMSIERLKFEGSDKDEKLKDPKSPYFNKQIDYAMAIYAYFQCFKCKKPYFGGRKNCMQVMNAEANQQNNGANFKAEQLVCPNCCDIPIQNCPKHGLDFIEFKCKFCCGTAQWFCFGNTHFCEPCHQIAGNVLAKKKQDLPKCLGPDKCPIGGHHNGNGEQRPLGCAICRSYKLNIKNF